MCNRIHFVYAHFSSSVVVGCRPSARQIFRPRLVSAIFALLFIHSFSFSLHSHRATRAKGLIILMSFYYDYIWLLRSLSLLPFSSSSSSSQCSFTIAMKKTEPRRRTNECRKPLCSLLSSYSIISQNYAPVMFSRLIYMVCRDIFMCSHFYFSLAHNILVFSSLFDGTY
jgi:hypothetical protein